MNRVLNRAVSAALIALGLGVIPAYAVVVPQEKALSEKSFRLPELWVPEVNQPLSEVPALAPALARELEELGVAPDQGFFDARTGRWSSLVLSRPLIPGTGHGNQLRWVDLAGAPPRDEAAIKAEVWSALSAFLQAHQSQLRVDMAELGTPRIGVFESAQLVQVHIPRIVAGVPVRDSGLTAIINHGNLILLGLQNWADVDAVAGADVSAEQARSIAAGHVSPRVVETASRGQRLELIPSLRDGRYAFRLVWAVPVKVLGDLGKWEALVDAGSGELLAFEDKNLYAQRKVIGGVYPVSNDQRPPDGVEQVGWPMPFLNVTVGPDTLLTTTGGNFGCAVGSATTALAGPFIRMADTCGAVNESSTTDIDLGSGPTAGATDCTVPAGHSAGDTKSSRSGFYELNKQVEQAKGWLPTNTWLFNQLSANMNLQQTCNAFWDGSTVNFFRSGGGCRNTGEIAAIFDHEWGHGMDNNGVNATISAPGEAIADIHGILRLKNSCMGRGFFMNQVCSGYGDACDGTPADGCTGVRDLDFMNHRCNQPHTITWAQTGFTNAQCGGTGPAPACPAGGGTPCGRETHCEGMVAAEVGWDLFARDLQAAPFNFDSNTALELATRMAFLGSQTLTNWYTCSVGGGCGATNGYMLFLAADDDNGNLNDGTPHMTAIRAAFERHEIHCPTPTPANSGCTGVSQTPPVVTATPTDSGITLSWGAVPGASRYNIFRTEGVAACDFGKAKVGETTTTTFTETGLLNGRAYSYVVIPVGSNLSCFGRASACTTATPVPGPNLSIRPTVTVTMTSGDGDEFLDNCENATINFTVENTGTGTLNNVRLVSVTPITHPTTVVNTPLPAPIAATLADCAIGNGSVSITPQGMTFNENTQLRLEVTADQIAPATRTQVVTIASVESDWINRATETFDFDTDFDSWAVRTGTWTRAAGGAAGTPFHLSSSENLEFQCDVIRSPLIRLSATSTLSLQNNYQIEPTDPVGGPYDRANVGVVDLVLGTRTVVSPSSGTVYTVPANPTPNYTACETGGQAGWNGTSPGYPNFAASNWTSAALNPGGVFTGRRTQLEIRYGTDPLLHLEGFDFDQVVLTNFDVQGPDAQGNTCVAQAVEPFAITVDAGGNGVFSPGETVSVNPRWRNIGTQPITLTGALSAFSGPGGTIVDGSATYGTIAAGANAPCADCYSLAIAGARPSQHWDSTVLETVTPTSTTKTWELHIGDSFTDVAAASPFYRFIETIFHNSVTGGCGGTDYCPVNSTTREQMAVFVLVSKEGAGYSPAACAPPNVFGDVPETSPFCRFIEELSTRGVVTGCGGGNYCPSNPVARQEMAIFVLRTLDPTFTPPACTTPMFTDVPASSPFCRWIEELARRGVVTGCGPNTYCPTDAVTREQMGVFLTATFGLTLYGL